jgi:hypothetical protein
MSNAMYFGNVVSLGTTAEHPTTRGRFLNTRLISLSRQSYAADPIGTTTVTFSGVNANSEIRVYLPNTTEVAGVELCVANQALIWSVYAGGSPNNTVRIVIVHPDYKIKEFTYTVALGNQSLPIQQELDKWYLNP